MVLNGLGRLVRSYPHVPGVDFAGTVEASSSPAWKPGDKVILTGWRVGEQHWGGHAAKARVMGDRSEERREGKECVSTGRSRWLAEHVKNKKKSVSRQLYK